MDILYYSKITSITEHLWSVSLFIHAAKIILFFIDYSLFLLLSIESFELRKKLQSFEFPKRATFLSFEVFRVTYLQLFILNYDFTQYLKRIDIDKLEKLRPSHSILKVVTNMLHQALPIILAHVVVARNN